VRPGLQQRYTVSVTNNGPDDATSVQLDSPMPAGLVFHHNSGDCTTGYPCAFATIAVGQTRTVTTDVCVPRGYVAPDPATFSAGASAATVDPTSTNDSASVLVPLLQSMFADGFDCGS
jgi:uncharacterized repeat protein (TIGR01451 family)